MKKKGFTLMEIVIVMGLAFLMLGAVGSILVSYVKSYKNSILQNNGVNYLNSSIFMIDTEVNEFARNVVTAGNKITIDCFRGNSPKIIKCVNGNLIVSTKSSEDGKYHPNTIMSEVKEFVAMKTGKILYIKIVWHNGQSIERFLAIENAN